MIQPMSQPRPGSFLFDPDYPRPANACDNQPAGPPRRMCPVCGLKYTPQPGRRSPCRHVKEDGTLDLTIDAMAGYIAGVKELR